MASSSIILSRSSEFCRRFVYNRQLSIGDFNEPFMTAANIVYQTILSPPFVWRWNRQVITFNTAAGTQDYLQACNFGYIENASVQDSSVTPSSWIEMTPKIDLALNTAQSRPEFISGQLDDGNGNITFRLMPTPDKVYPVSVTLQQKAPLLTSLNQTWAPIPDEFSFIFQTGVLSWMYTFADDSRAAGTRQQFVSHLLGASEGLTATQVNIFLSNFQNLSLAQPEKGIQMQQGNQARGSY
jgi:hypothetical protein